ncbi:MAG TPA: DGQHR domain-containing protein [Devosia sp.]|nr:DGQHR domain-containing protein [Devosia sp.]
MEAAETEGWEVRQKDEKRAKVRRRKPLDLRLENRFWTALYRLGFDELSPTRGFKITVSKKNEPALSKQIDVFAKDAETVIVAECKSCDAPRRRSLQKDLNEFIALKGPIADAIKKHYGKDFKPKIIWFFVTENVIWSKQDLERARQERIQVMRESEYRYFSQIIEHLGSAARPQFLAEYLSGADVPGLENVTTPAIRGTLGGQKFYSFVATPEQLLKIAFVNHRALNDPEGAPSYQRLVQRSRLRQISKFLSAGGFFPNSILINFKGKVRFDPLENDRSWPVQFGMLYFPTRYKSAWVVDGQHRLYAYGELEEARKKEHLIVVAFERLPEADEANLFVTINHEQKRVPKNLLDELEGELKWGSHIPKERMGAIASRLIALLNGDNASPFYGKVATPGIKQSDDVPLTVPEFKVGILATRLLGAELFKGKQYQLGYLCGENDKATLDKAADAFNAYFDLLKEANPERWNRGKAGYLCSNISIGGHIRLFEALATFAEGKTKQDLMQLEGAELVGQLRPYLEPVISFVKDASDEEFAGRFKPRFGSGGMVRQYYKLCEQVAAHTKGFSPAGYAEWMKRATEDETKYADEAVRRLQTIVQDATVAILKKEYGAEYLERAVHNDDILTKAFARQLEEKRKGDNRDLHVFLDLMDFKSIIEHKSNWQLFRQTFDIPMEGDKGLAKNLRWLDSLNTIRRIPAHPSSGRQYKPEDIEFLRWLEAELAEKIEIGE